MERPSLLIQIIYTVKMIEITYLYNLFMLMHFTKSFYYYYDRSFSVNYNLILCVFNGMLNINTHTHTHTR
jgi:hypothetical protein